MKIIDNNPDRFFSFTMFLVDGGTPWEFRLDTACFAGGASEAGKNLASEFFDLFHKLVLNVGGALPLIVDKNLVEDDWRTQLKNAAEKPLDRISLENLAEALKNVPIYVTADDKLVTVPADVEAKFFWTLSPDQFQGNFISVPDLAQARLLIFVRSLRNLKSNLEIFHWDQGSVEARGAACRGIVGSAVKFVHELTHAARLRKSLLPNFHWTLSDSGWGLSLEEMKIVATPRRLSLWSEERIPVSCGRRSFVGAQSHGGESCRRISTFVSRSCGPSPRQHKFGFCEGRTPLRITLRRRGARNHGRSEEAAPDHADTRTEP